MKWLEGSTPIDKLRANIGSMTSEELEQLHTILKQAAQSAHDNQAHIVGAQIKNLHLLVYDIEWHDDTVYCK